MCTWLDHDHLSHLIFSSCGSAVLSALVSATSCRPQARARHGAFGPGWCWCAELAICMAPGICACARVGPDAGPAPCSAMCTATAPPFRLPLPLPLSLNWPSCACPVPVACRDQGMRMHPGPAALGPSLITSRWRRPKRRGMHTYRSRRVHVHVGGRVHVHSSTCGRARPVG